MEVKKFVIEATVEGIKVYADDVVLGLIQHVDLTVDAEPQPTFSAVVKLWKKIGDSDPVSRDSLVDKYTGTTGAYVTPFTNKLELVTEPIILVPKE